MNRIDEIRETALRLFIEKGYGTTSIRDIAAEVGINSATLYHYFPSKYDILIDIVSEAWRSIFDEVTRRMAAAHDSWTERLHTFVNFHVEHHCNNTEQVRITSEAIRHFHQNALTIFQGRRDDYQQILIDILDQGREAGEFHFDDVKITSYAILQMLTGIANWYRPSGRLTPADISDLYWDLIRGMVHIGDSADPPAHPTQQSNGRSHDRAAERSHHGSNRRMHGDG
jgi:AcrR family transcriptional regulator